MDLRIITRHERSQAKINADCMIQLVENYRNFELIYSGKEQIRGLESIRKESLQRRKRKLWGLIDVFIILLIVLASQEYSYVKAHRIIHF